MKSIRCAVDDPLRIVYTQHMKGELKWKKTS